MWALFDYMDGRGHNDFMAWLNGLQTKQRARLDQKIDMLEEHGTGLPATLLSHTPNRNIKKIRVGGQVALRPLLCIGPIDTDGEFTLLMGATERDSEFVPSNAVETAFARRAEVIADPMRRRCPHGEEPQAETS